MSIPSYVTIPNGLIVFISGVPGAGKTTISYELFKHCGAFRIIQETDLIREILRGYNLYIEEIGQDKVPRSILQAIPDHTKIFNYEELKAQCEIMRKSIEEIVKRQQRKGIPSIINGVHIVPEVLDGVAQNSSVKYINLYINSIEVLHQRLSCRDPQKYLPYLDVSFNTNCALGKSVQSLSQAHPTVFHNLDVTGLSINETLESIIKFIKLERS